MLKGLLSTLPTRHPIGDVLLNRFGASVVLRLGIDPTRQPSGIVQRDITVERNTPATRGRRVRVARTIGWGGLPFLSEEYCRRLSRTANQNDRTEEAAIGVMALLIHDLEGLAIERVGEIGSGCDYFVRPASRRRLIPVEVSGVYAETAGGQANTRLRAKREQVLSVNKAGYLSVTTFRHSEGGVVHSYLHYVTTSARHRTRKRRKRK